jgi:hypothetical protein
MRWAIGAFAAAVMAGTAAQAESPLQAPQATVYRDVAPMNRTVETRIRPQMEALLQKLLAEGRGMRLDGVEVFSGDDKFLPGKIAAGLADLVVSTPREDPRFQGYLDGFRRIADLTVEDTNDTWGIYYYIAALHQLDQAGLLEKAVAPATLAKLKAKLDWRTFVREGELTLIDLPNNYYGVAYSVARLRMLLGWEDASASEALLAKTLEHYRTYSGEFGFADETTGEGRFDRYSVLLIGEIAQRFIETGVEPTPEVKTWLRRSVDLVLPRFNMTGEGFEYGRSIGAYGDTSFIEVLTAAAALNILTEEEKRMAYAFSSRISARYADFWLNPATGSVDLWERGRRTDAYRGKHRILGENLSLSRQHYYTSALWSRLGFKDAAPDPGYEAWLKTLPPVTVTWFSKGEYDRALLTRRDRGHVVSLPLINGGGGQHMNNPYFPVPFSPSMLQGSADATYPNLLPRLALADGTTVAPLAFFKDVRFDTKGRRTTVSLRQDELDRLGERAPVKDTRVKVETRYTFEPGRIVRTDRFIPNAPVDVAKIEIEFGSFSGDATVRSGDVRFGQGDVTRFTVKGAGACTAEAVDGRQPYRAPTGALATRVACATGPMRLERPHEVRWTLEYR